MRTRQVLASVASLLLLSACGVATAAPATSTPTVTTPAITTGTPGPTVTASGPPSGDKVGPDGELYSQAAATARAAKDVARVHLPAGATLQRTPVPTALLHFTQDLGSLTGVVTHWWKVPGKAAAVQAYVLHHPPKGLQGGVTTGPLHGETGLDYQFPTGVKQPRTLVAVNIAQDGGHVDVEVRAFVVWTPTRSAVETVHGSVTSARVAFQPLTATGELAKLRTVVVSGANLRLIAHTLNKLEASSELGHSCPGGDVEWVTITMSYGTHQLTFTADGVPQPALARPDLLLAAVHTALHLKP